MPSLRTPALLFGSVLAAGVVAIGSLSRAQGIDDPWDVFTLHCETMQNRLTYEIRNDEDLRLSYNNLKLNYDAVDEYRSKVPEKQRTTTEYRQCVDKLPEVKKLLAKAVALQKEQDKKEKAESQARHDASPELAKARELGLDDYAGLIGIYSSIKNGYVDRGRLTRYLVVADDWCAKRFKATGQVGPYYILSVDDTNRCGFGLVQVALKRTAGVSYREGEYLKHQYFRIVGTEEFQKTNGFAVTLVVLEAIKG
jgi:hypothetical protein